MERRAMKVRRIVTPQFRVHPAMQVTGKHLRGFIVRKEAKQHGTGRDVEGPVSAGDSVIIVEDVVTTGGSSLAAIEKAEAFGLKVRGVMAIIDRLEGGREVGPGPRVERSAALHLERNGRLQPAVREIEPPAPL